MTSLRLCKYRPRVRCVAGCHNIDPLLHGICSQNNPNANLLPFVLNGFMCSRFNSFLSLTSYLKYNTVDAQLFFRPNCALLS